MPVEVVLRDVEHRAGSGFEIARILQLEAGELQHPDFRQGVGV